MAKEKKGKQPSGDLQRIITEGRERKKVQDTADKIFGKRTLGGKKADRTGGSLTNRAGVNKQRLGPSNSSAKPNSLAARSNGRGAIVTPTGPRADLRATRNAQGIADALFSSKPTPAKVHVNIVPNRSSNATTRHGGTQFAGAAGPQQKPRQRGPPIGGLTIKGLAGPHIVEIRGFAPGTTAADVEEALRNKGIPVHSCRVIQSSPKVIVDILCDNKEDADRLGEFHQQWTDYDSVTGKGFQLFVFPPRPVETPTAPRAQPARNNGVLVDGSMGFDPLPVDHGTGGSGLYSDQLMHNNQNTNHQNNSYQSRNNQRSSQQNNNRRGRGLRGGQASNSR